jgi:GNAT superfamily N-acetyltransferase
MNITYSEEKDIDPETVRDFFCTYATWKVPTGIKQWKRMLLNSCAVVSAWDGDRLIGTVRGLSDEVRFAKVLDILVHPEYRRTGIGTEIMLRLLSHPTMQVRGVSLGTPDQREFYEKLGVKCVNEKAYFMVLVRDEYGEGLIQPVEA